MFEPETTCCRTRKLTPGKVARRDKDRNGVTEEMERKVFDRYHIPWRRRPEFKVDHLIPAELGGADTIDNLWPQSLYTKPYNAQRKELLTQRLLARIASRRNDPRQSAKGNQRGLDLLLCRPPGNGLPAITLALREERNRFGYEENFP